MNLSGVSLEVRNLKKDWGAVNVLSGINFTIEPGTFLTLLGPSGCGKSTALRLISGLDEITAGQILVGGNDVSKTSASARNIGMVFQNYALFPHMTVAENITYGLKIRKVPAKARKEGLDRVADLMGLGKLLSRKPAQLSGGQQQRVALARVLVSERPLVLMDEPLSNLDAKLRAEIRTEIRELNKRLGITVVYVTHDQSEALSMSDKVLLMNNGVAVQFGDPKELYDAPADTFAASFIGTPPMNLLDAGDLTSTQALAGLYPGDASDLLVGVRPENLKLSDKAQEFAVSAKVANVEYEGSVSLVHLITPSGARMVVSNRDATVPAEGHQVFATWDRASSHLFNKKTGAAIAIKH